MLVMKETNIISIQFYVKYLFIFPSDGIDILQVKLLMGICLQSVCLFIGSFWHFSQTVLLELVFAFLCPLKGHERGSGRTPDVFMEL